MWCTRELFRYDILDQSCTFVKVRTKKLVLYLADSLILMLLSTKLSL